MTTRTSAAIALLTTALLLLPLDAGEAQERSCRTTKRDRIVGGDPANIQNWPAQAALRLHSKAGQVSFYFCGGTAIADRWILTAAHCLPEYVSKLTGQLRDSKGKPHQGQLEVVLGAGDLRHVRPDQVFAVERVIVQERYRSEVDKALQIADLKQRRRALARIAPAIGDDVALLRLARPWTGAPMELSLLAATDPATPPGTQVRVAGYGTTEHNKDKVEPDRFDRADGKGELFAGSAILLETAIETIATPKCKQSYSAYAVSDGQVCAGLDQGGKDSCQGDSGGPLVAMDARGCVWQIGLVSWGEGCAEKKAYGVYTRVSHHAEWIQKHTGPLKGYLPPRGAGDRQHLDRVAARRGPAAARWPAGHNQGPRQDRGARRQPRGAGQQGDLRGRQ